ncbi:two-component system regulatory protein YycI [Tenuibacillus multivorans]|uniref:Two-component signal transduction system YycFG, regulatory protein YycI n=1 Tax=Tenuibacillus multivorans TaxID=237069 RepID=A0A1G9W950_9BACI|nr:two-component system regulatory protein YycI [Tenuibacillus multivorans]GEL76353.1 hypothetical protein TMU01_05880 [Tenuibacillus multivorans]SDM80797.1 Two-component signal transduction system YycFG, regulatory protein YycI [Tenuibacillus multivorans]
MQWGQIKTIFIISFLILNLFLVQQLMDKIDQTNLETLDTTTLEEQLEAEGIEYTLPESGQKETYVSAERYQLTEDDLTQLEEKLDTQNIAVFNEVIVGEFIEPLEVDIDDEMEQAIATIKENIMYGDRYTFWDYYEEENVLLFFQNQNDRTVYFNESGVLIVVLDEDGHAIQYRQTILEDVVKQSEEQTVIEPINALDVLYSNGNLVSQDEVTSMNIGYHTLVPLEDGVQVLGVQVFVPTWEITINGEETYFVNAMEGQYIPNDEAEFVIKIKEHLKRQIEELNRSETE